VGFKEEYEELLNKHSRTDWAFGLAPMFGTMADDVRGAVRNCPPGRSDFD
jgi:hypothetical protein